MQALAGAIPGRIIDITPGIRSLQIHFQPANAGAGYAAGMGPAGGPRSA